MPAKWRNRTARLLGALFGSNLLAAALRAAMAREDTFDHLNKGHLKP